ncbi:hypothetical protein AURDEDRAFT_131822, partial [Auricularia subglabra TFB-10046 SS5]
GQQQQQQPEAIAPPNPPSDRGRTADPPHSTKDQAGKPDGVGKSNKARKPDGTGKSDDKGSNAGGTGKSNDKGSNAPAPSQDSEPSHGPDGENDDEDEDDFFDEVLHSPGTLLDSLKAALDAIDIAGPRDPDSRAASAQIDALAVVHGHIRQMLEYACSSLGFSWERAARNFIDMGPSRGGNRYNLFKTFIRCTDEDCCVDNQRADYEPRRRFDDKFGNESKYTSAEYKEFYAELLEELGQQELDKVLLAFDARYPYGTSDPTTGDREKTFKVSTGRFDSLFKSNCAKFGLEGFYGIVGADPATDRTPRMAKFFRTFHVRNFAEQKLFLSEAEVPVYLQGHVLDSVANTRRAKTLVERGGKLPLFITINDALGPASTSAAPDVVAGQGRRRGKGQETVKANSVYFQAMPDDTTYRFRHSDLIEGETSTAGLVTRRENNIYLAQVPYPPSAEGTLCNADTSTVEYTIGERRVAEVIFCELFKPWFKLSGKGFPLSKAFTGSRKHGLTLSGWDPGLYIWDEARKRTSYHGLGDPMKCLFIGSVLNGHLGVSPSLEIPDEFKDTFPLMPQEATRVLVLTDKIARLTNIPKCYWGSCRAYLDNGMVLGMHTSLVARAYPPWGPPARDSTWDGVTAWNARRRAKGLSTVEDDPRTIIKAGPDDEEDEDDDDDAESEDGKDGDKASTRKSKGDAKGKAKVSAQGKAKGKRQHEIDAGSDDDYEDVDPPRQKEKATSKRKDSTGDTGKQATSKANGNGKRNQAVAQLSDAGTDKGKPPAKRARKHRSATDGVEKSKPAAKKKKKAAPKSAAVVPDSDDEKRENEKKLAAAKRKLSSQNANPHKTYTGRTDFKYDENFEEDDQATREQPDEHAQPVEPAQPVQPVEPAQPKETQEQRHERTPSIASDSEPARLAAARGRQATPGPAWRVSTAQDGVADSAQPPADAGAENGAARGSGKGAEGGKPSAPLRKVRVVDGNRAHSPEKAPRDGKEERRTSPRKPGRAADKEEQAEHASPSRKSAQPTADSLAPKATPRRPANAVAHVDGTPLKTLRHVQFDSRVTQGKNIDAWRATLDGDLDDPEDPPRRPSDDDDFSVSLEGLDDDDDDADAEDADSEGDVDELDSDEPSHRTNRRWGAARLTAASKRAAAPAMAATRGKRPGAAKGDDASASTASKAGKVKPPQRPAAAGDASSSNEEDLASDVAHEPAGARKGNTKGKAAAATTKGKAAPATSKGKTAPATSKGKTAPATNKRKREEDEGEDDEEAAARPQRKRSKKPGRDPKYSTFLHADKIPSSEEYDFLFTRRTALKPPADRLTRVQRQKLAFVCPDGLKTNE